MDGWTDGRTDAKVVLYSVQCCTLHWTDNNIDTEKLNVTYVTLNIHKAGSENFEGLIIPSSLSLPYFLLYILWSTAVR